jgi:hypothetical protein
LFFLFFHPVLLKKEKKSYCWVANPASSGMRRPFLKKFILPPTKPVHPMHYPVKHLTLLFLSLALLFVACDAGPRDGAASEQPAEETTNETTTRPVDPEQKEMPSSLEKTELSQDELIQKGMTIANRAFAVLSTELSRAINAGGVPSALDYCKLNAYPLLDSISRANNALIKRTSFKLRNPNNIAGPEEERILRTYESAINENGDVDYKEFRPRLMDGGDHWSFYAPITLRNAVCLKCHGKIGLDIKNEDYAKIRELYPQDKANGYALGDLRGIWSIQFKK